MNIHPSHPPHTHDTPAQGNFWSLKLQFLLVAALATLSFTFKFLGTSGSQELDEGILDGMDRILPNASERKKHLEDDFADDNVAQEDLGSFEGIEGLTATADESGVRLTLDQSVLFTSGSAEVTRKGQDTLKKMSGIIRSEYANRKIRVEGHTDSTPITKTKSRWASNWELSSYRACAVLRRLLKEGAVNSSNISAIGFADQRPVGDNKTKVGRRMNRRVEIIVEN